MAVTLGTLTVSALRAQPLGYDETDVVNGLVARRWAIEGLLRPAEWLDLLSIFETWQAERLTDQDTLVSLTVGTTVSFSGSALGYSWTDVACWFAAAPAAEVVGAYIGASFELIDAEQQLAVLLRQRETETETETAVTPDYGTITLGDVTLTLTAQPDGYAGPPTLERTAAGGVVIKGPLGVVHTKRVEGYTDATGWGQFQDWYEAAVQATPTAGDYYPAGEPTMSKEMIVVGGVLTTRYNISIELWEV